MLVAVREYAAGALAPTTQRTYEAAVRRFREWAVDEGVAPAAEGMIARCVTPVVLASFLQHLEITTSLSHRTICTYRSAISSWWRAQTLSDEQPPGASTAVELVLRAIERRRAAQEHTADVGYSTVALTAELLERLCPAATSAELTPTAARYWGAASMGVYGLLRIGELVGGPAERELTVARITFFSRPGPDSSIAPISSRGVAAAGAWLPDRYVIATAPSKTDQSSRLPPVIIAAQPAVRALWRYMHIRAQLLDAAAVPPSDGRRARLWSLPSEPDLTRSALLTWLSERATEVLGRSITFTGKCFRRGGATSLLAGGAPRPDIMAAGRWATPRMVDVYSSSAARDERRAAVSRAMAPLSAPPASIPGSGSADGAAR